VPTLPASGGGPYGLRVLKVASVSNLSLSPGGDRGRRALSPEHVPTESGPGIRNVAIDTNEARNSSDSSDSEDDSSDTVEDHEPTDSNVPLSSHLSQLLDLGGRSIYSLQGREAAEAGSKLHSVSF
jgi:hypothetical protein